MEERGSIVKLNHLLHSTCSTEWASILASITNLSLAVPSNIETREKFVSSLKQQIIAFLSRSLWREHLGYPTGFLRCAPASSSSTSAPCPRSKSCLFHKECRGMIEQWLLKCLTDFSDRVHLSCPPSIIATVQGQLFMMLGDTRRYASSTTPDHEDQPSWCSAISYYHQSALYFSRNGLVFSHLCHLFANAPDISSVTRAVFYAVRAEALSRPFWTSKKNPVLNLLSKGKTLTLDLFNVSNLSRLAWAAQNNTPHSFAWTHSTVKFETDTHCRAALHGLFLALVSSILVTEGSGEDIESIWAEQWSLLRPTLAHPRSLQVLKMLDYYQWSIILIGLMRRFDPASSITTMLQRTLLRILLELLTAHSNPAAGIYVMKFVVLGWVICEKDRIPSAHPVLWSDCVVSMKQKLKMSLPDHSRIEYEKNTTALVVARLIEQHPLSIDFELCGFRPLKHIYGGFQVLPPPYRAEETSAAWSYEEFGEIAEGEIKSLLKSDEVPKLVDRISRMVTLLDHKAPVSEVSSDNTKLSANLADYSLYSTPDLPLRLKSQNVRVKSWKSSSFIDRVRELDIGDSTPSSVIDGPDSAIQSLLGSEFISSDETTDSKMVELLSKKDQLSHRRHHLSASSNASSDVQPSSLLLLDTNVWLSSLHQIQTFISTSVSSNCHRIAVCSTVLAELRGLSLSSVDDMASNLEDEISLFSYSSGSLPHHQPEEHQLPSVSEQARRALLYIQEATIARTITFLSPRHELPEGLTGDDSILTLCQHYRDGAVSTVTLVSRDANFRLKAKALGVMCVKELLSIARKMKVDHIGY